MMGQGKKAIALIVLIVGLILLFNSLFVVKEWERVIKFRLGEIIQTDFTPGLHFKVPFINNVRKYDGRIMTLDSAPELYLTAEKKNVIVDSFVKWRIKSIASYYTAMGGDERRANQRLAQVVKDSLRGEFGKRSIQEVVSGERNEVMEIINVNANKVADELGIAVIDVRIKRIDLPDDISENVYRRMEAERDREAKDKRAKGAEEAERITADADRQRTILLAEAYSEAEQARGEGDGKAAEIYAKAYSQDAEFYSFYRSINAYSNAFRQKSDILVVQPDADFFRYFSDKNGIRKK